MKPLTLLSILSGIFALCLPASAQLSIGTTTSGSLAFENSAGNGAAVSSISVTLPTSTFFDSSGATPGTAFTPFSVSNNVGVGGVVLPDSAATDGQRTAVFSFTGFDPGDSVRINCDYDLYASPDGSGDPVGAVVTVTYGNGQLATGNLASVTRTVSGASWPISLILQAPIAQLGSLSTARYAHSSTLLPNGKVLVVGGNNSSDSPLAAAELYDPSTGTWSATGSLATARFNHAATLLPNGKVLVAGGKNGSSSLASAEIYDPATGFWSATGSLATARYGYTATVLANGKVLVAGGYNGSSYFGTAELYDPATGTWSSTGSLATARYAHAMSLLPNGKVLIVGGYNGSHPTSSEIYDPATGSWSTTGSLAFGGENRTATLLPNGKVLVAGGYNRTNYLTSAQLYDPAAGTWSVTGSLATARYAHSASLLPNGKVLVTAGYGNSGILSSAELYDPAAGTWSATTSLASARYGHPATLLPNGNVLVAGGYNGGALNSTQLYEFASGSWGGTGSLATARQRHTTTLLPTGKVLVAAGFSSTGGFNIFNSAELYDPAVGAWTVTGSLATARYDHTASLLPNGKLLVAGGNAGGSYPVNVELYDAATGTWTTTGSLATARYGHTATLLPNGKLLVAGGSGPGSVLASAELYDPATGAWTATGTLATARYSHTATLLSNGKVLVAGGTGNIGNTISSAEIYDPAAGTWSTTTSLATARYGQTATLLPNGKLLVAGGFDGSNYLVDSELYDSATGTWTATGSLVTARSSHNATLLPNGRLLVAGGTGNSGGLTVAELYDPASGTWANTGSLATARIAHAATLLPNGKLLVAAGTNGSGTLASAELYDVGLGFSNSAQPVISSATINGAGKLVLVGTRFSGISGASGGNGVQDSATNYPVVQIRRLDNEQCTFVLPDPATNTFATAFTSLAIAPFSGYAMATVFTNGIPSAGTIITYQQPASVPVVTGPVASSITDSSAVLGGTISSDGGAAITARGIVYAVTATNPNPALGGVGVVNNTASGTTGVFTLNVSGLLPNILYSFTAYATNSSGTAYSSVGSFITLSPDITLEQPVGSALANGGTRNFGTTVVGTPSSLTFTISNRGNSNLTGLTITMNGTDAGDFNVTALPSAPVMPGGSTSFTVQFNPTGGITGMRNGTLQIANNVISNNPFIINLAGQALTQNSDTDGDALNDASEYDMAALGFNWQVAQTSLVNTYRNSANRAGYYSLSQVQGLNVGTPLIQRNANTGQFKLTLGLEKSTNLSSFTPFPFTAPQTTVNGQGKIEFLFTSPDNAAFFRLRAE